MKPLFTRGFTYTGQAVGVPPRNTTWFFSYFAANRCRMARLCGRPCVIEVGCVIMSLWRSALGIAGGTSMRIATLHNHRRLESCSITSATATQSSASTPSLLGIATHCHCCFIHVTPHTYQVPRRANRDVLAGAVAKYKAKAARGFIHISLAQLWPRSVTLPSSDSFDFKFGDTTGGVAATQTMTDMQTKVLPFAWCCLSLLRGAV